MRLPAGDLGGHLVVQADELRHERRRRVGVQLGGGGELLELALAHHPDPVGDGERLLLVVRDEQCRRADIELYAADLVAQRRAHLGVEGRQRLVQQQHPRLDRECPSQRDTLLLAAGQLAGVLVPMSGQPDELEHLVGAR